MPGQRLTGKKAEDVACGFLKRNGLILIERNYHCRFGEIDLIMQDTDTLVFVEVRYRSSEKYGSAAESVDGNKQRKLVFTANHYLQKYPSNQPTRFDVVALSPHQQPEWITNAFMDR
ncbi:MAG: YraN family protein [Gammaproteobacteria bacterium]|nr:YraN family protein [Gammaproteobacteria bacterium]